MLAVTFIWFVIYYIKVVIMVIPAASICVFVFSLDVTTCVAADVL